MAQNKCTQGANINDMHVNLSWLKVDERLTSSLLGFVRGVDKLNVPSIQHTARTPMYTPQDMPPEVSSQSSSPEQTMGGAQYYIEP